MENKTSADKESYSDMKKNKALNQSLQMEIEKRQDAEKALAESDELLKLALKNTDNIITIQDLEGKYIYFNSPNVFNIHSNKVIGKTPYDFFESHYASNIMDRFNKVISTGDSVSSEFEMDWQGVSLWFFDHSSPVRDSNGKIKTVITFSQNITKRKNSDAAFLEMQKLESVGTLAGGIAHEFNNIMTGVFGNISIAKEQLSKEHPSLKFLENAEKSMNRAILLTKQLLTFAKGGSPIKENTDMGILVNEIVRFDLGGSNVKPVFDIPDDLWIAEVDTGQIQQVFSNLTINANQAMPDGGHLYISLENADIPEDKDLNLKKGKYIKITMQDEGVGINKKYFNKIFDPYFSTKQTGSGLGLTTVFSIINKHNGNVSVKSEPNKGAVFTVYLPALESQHNVKIKSTAKIEDVVPTEKIPDVVLTENIPEIESTENIAKVDEEAKIEVKPKQQYDAKVLVMDDEEMILTVVTEVLNTIGIKVDTAPDGETAIEMYKTAIADSKPFDVVIMDLTIPGGMGGKEAVKNILEIDPKAKVIVSSGYSIDPVMANYSEYGFKGIIAKPYTLNKLQNIIIKILSLNN